MSLLSLVVTLIVIGILLWLVETQIPMAAFRLWAAARLGRDPGGQMRMRLARWIMRTAAKLASVVGGPTAFSIDVAEFYSSYGKKESS